MKRNGITLYLIGILIGILTLATGIFVMDDHSKSIAGFCFGIGTGLMGMYIAKLIIYLYYERHPALKKQSEIDSKDERTVAITYKAKAKAFDITTAILMIIPFLLILIDVSLWMILATIAIYLFGFFVQIYCTIQYGKQM
jgi:hypothetical protein